jgi:plasmid stability protein
MSITIELPEETEQALRKRAMEHGQEVEEFILALAKREAARQHLDEGFAPVQNAFQQSGLKLDEIDALLESELDAVRQKRRGDNG